MRLWLKDSERRPDPVPPKTDDRKPILIGIGLWLVALVAVLLLGPLLAPADRWWVWACVAGLVLGVIGLIYIHRRR
ncbi:DUF2530 domain-containing protein [Homoserinimonas sp. A520]